MTVLVNLRNSEEEKALLAFLNTMKYDYQTEVDGSILTTHQQEKVLRREHAFAEGKTAARSWEDIKKDFEDLYR